MRLSASDIWPKCLTDKNVNELQGELLAEGLKATHLISSVSGTKDLIAWVRGRCRDIITGDILEFEALWAFDESRISHPTRQYTLEEVEIFE